MRRECSDLCADLLQRAPARIVDAWISGAFDLIVCPKLLGELSDVVTRAKLRSLVDPEASTEYVRGLKEGALLLFDPTDERSVTPDTDDDYLITLAVEGEADYLVSGDRHLNV